MCRLVVLQSEQSKVRIKGVVAKCRLGELPQANSDLVKAYIAELDRKG